VFWPLLAIIKAFIKREYRFLKIFLPLFTGVLGYTYQPQKGSDVNMAIERFEVMRQLSFTSKLENLIVTRFSNLLNVGFEIYIDLVAFITSLLTDNFRWALFIFGFVYGVILYNFFKGLVQSELKLNLSLLSKILLFFIVLFIQPSMALNGRFWLAMLLFLNFVVSYYNNPKLKYILLSFLCVFIHKGFLAAFILFFIWHYTKQIKFKKYMFMSLLFISFITPSSLMLGVVRQGNDSLGEAYTEQIEGYTREKYIDIIAERSQNRSTLFNIYSKKNILIFYSSLFFLFFLYVKKYYRLSENLENMFYLVILFISFSNLFIDVPSLGSRYRFISTGLMLVFFYKALNFVTISPYKLPSGVLILSLAFALVINLRMEFEQLYGFSYILNPVFSFLVEDDLTVMDIIK
jgi:hypothetical protein